MRKFWDRFFGLDDNLSIWVEEHDLGREILISRRKRNYYVMIPAEINQKITLRLRGLGKKDCTKQVIFIFIYGLTREKIKRHVSGSLKRLQEMGEKK